MFPNSSYLGLNRLSLFVFIQVSEAVLFLFSKKTKNNLFLSQKLFVTLPRIKKKYCYAKETSIIHSYAAALRADVNGGIWTVTTGTA